MGDEKCQERKKGKERAFERPQQVWKLWISLEKGGAMKGEKASRFEGEFTPVEMALREKGSRKKFR